MLKCGLRIVGDREVAITSPRTDQLTPGISKLLSNLITSKGTEWHLGSFPVSSWALFCCHDNSYLTKYFLMDTQPTIRKGLTNHQPLGS